MVDFETISAVIFLVGLSLFLSIQRKNLEIKQMYNFFFSMYRTSFGLRLMDSLVNKFQKFFIYTGYFGILIGFFGMLFIIYALISGIFSLFLKPESGPAVGLVLPVPVKIPGIFGIPFSYWIMSIFVIAVVHEFAHGVIARAHGMKVKSSGFAFAGANLKIIGLIIILFSIITKLKKSGDAEGAIFGINLLSSSSPDFWLLVGILLLLISLVRNLLVPIIPAAFVEPDEKELRKRPHIQQLSVFAAGPFANIVVGIVFLIIFLGLINLAGAVYEPNGVKIARFVEGNQTFPAEAAGIKIGEVIKQIDGFSTPHINNLSDFLQSKIPGALVKIQTDKSAYEIKLAKNPENESLAYLGAYLEQSIEVKDKFKRLFNEPFSKLFLWFIGLIEMLFVLNLGIGSFNLLPFGPLDGGRMFQLPVYKIFGKQKGDKVLSKTNLIILFILLIYIAVILKNIFSYFVQ